MPSRASPTGRAYRSNPPRSKRVPTGVPALASMHFGQTRYEDQRPMMNTVLTSALKALPVFAAHFGVTLVILIGGVLIYQALTPQNEARLIRENNVAAAT